MRYGMVADAAPFARMRWRQSGLNGFGKDGSPATGRNLFGQVDGSANPAPGTDLFDEAVWASEPGWFAGGTTLGAAADRGGPRPVGHRHRAEQEASIGRRLADGAPSPAGPRRTTSTHRDQARRPVIAMRAMPARASPDEQRLPDLPQGLNYTHATTAPAGPRAGCSFLSYC
jgi:dye decolorizing peroxidase